MRAAALSRWNPVWLAILAVAFLCTSPAAAGMKQLELDGEDSGWSVEWHPLLDPYVDIDVVDVDLDGDEVVIRKIAQFTQEPSESTGVFSSIAIVFSQTTPEAVSRIRIDEEVITNVANVGGVAWGGFHMDLTGGNEAEFNQAETEASGTSGFNVSPFVVRSYGPGVSGPFRTFEALVGSVPEGGVWNPGNDGDLVIDVVAPASPTLTSFVLKERPLPLLVNEGISEPASSLLACIGLVVLAMVRRRAGP